MESPPKVRAKVATSKILINAKLEDSRAVEQNFPLMTTHGYDTLVRRAMELVDLLYITIVLGDVV